MHLMDEPEFAVEPEEEKVLDLEIRIGGKPISTKSGQTT